MGKCQSQLTNPPKEYNHIRLSLKSTMDVSDEEEGNWSTPAASVSVSQSSLSIFNEDILLSILSYVADVPFEMMGAAGEKKTMPCLNICFSGIVARCTRFFLKLRISYLLTICSPSISLSHTHQTSTCSPQHPLHPHPHPSTDIQTIS
jgi:hypothetical protein